MRNKLFSSIYANIGSNVQDTSSAFQTVAKRYANGAYFEILRRINWDAINHTHTITTVAGTQDYVLPTDFGKELYVNDQTNLIPIHFISLGDLADKYPATLSTQGSVLRYTIIESAVRAQPTSASTLSLVSSAAGDTTQTVRIKGTDANNVELDESVTLNGTSSQASSNTYLTIRSITKDGTTTGRITITSNSGAVTVAVMQPADLDYKVKLLRLHYVPSGVITLGMPYHIRPLPLVNDNDVPVFDCADGIELKGTAHSWRYKRQFAKAKEFDRLFETWLADTAWDQENQPNQTHQINPVPYSRETV